VHTLIPNAAVLSKHLTTFAEACSATEVVLFERTTFLVIATSSPVAPPSISSPQSPGAPIAEQDHLDIHKLDPTRYERTSELIKGFKHSCSRVREEFHSLEMELHDFTAVLDEMTRNTYVLIIVHDPTIGACFRFPLTSLPTDCFQINRDCRIEAKYKNGSTEVRRTPRR
jgi:Ras-related GTP-binding protein A/B